MGFTGLQRGNTDLPRQAMSWWVGQEAFGDDPGTAGEREWQDFPESHNHRLWHSSTGLGSSVPC